MTFVLFREVTVAELVSLLEVLEAGAALEKVIVRLACNGLWIIKLLK